MDNHIKFAAIAAMLCCAAAYAGDQQRPAAAGKETGGAVLPEFSTLDANGDGVIDETEIGNASVALKKLDKNGDGKLTPEELRPPRPDGDRGRPDGGTRPRPKPPEQQ